MQTVLAKIVADKAIWVEARKQQQPLASFQNEVQPSTRHFYDALQGARTAFILECKKASPSKGVIRDDFDPARIAAIYKHYASAISVLTDEKYFQGSFNFLPIVSQIAPQPILCKDFIIDPYQIYLTVISESGINTYAQVRELSHFANGFLIGSALMAHDDLHAAVRRVLLGENKVCGLTRGQDAKAAYDAGAIYGGLIFVATSPRCVNVEQAQEVMAAAPLQYVGVFRNHDIADVVDKAKVLSLAAVQLHGNEEQLYIDTLREALPAHVAIWKALSVGETLPAREFQHVDKYVLDNGQGGSGQRFDWSLLNGQSLGNVLLAGGLGADNCVEAAQTGCAGLDFNSAVESQPGIKDARLLASVFQTLRAY